MPFLSSYVLIRPHTPAYTKTAKIIGYALGMATFTTWTALRDQMRNQLASRDFSRASASVAGHTVAWANPRDFMAVLADVEARAALETGAVSLRVHLRDGGRG